MNKIDRQILSVLSPRTWMYGLEIQDAIRERYKSKVSIGGLYPALRWLESEGLIESCWQGENGTAIESLAVRGGARRRCYRLTKGGLSAFNKLAGDSDEGGSIGRGSLVPV